MKLNVLPSTIFALILISFTSCHIVNLKLGKESEPFTTECDHYSYFSVEITHACDDLVIKLNQLAGEPNLYVSRDPFKHPTYRSLAWSSYDWGGDELVISSWDPNFDIGKYYIGVHSYCGPDVATGFEASKYTILTKQVPHTHPETVDLFNKSETGLINAKDYKYYRFCIPSNCFKVEVRLDNCIDPKICPETYSWPELIISKTVERPNEKSMAWILAEYEHRSIFLDGSSTTINPGHFFIAVYGWCTPEKFCHNKTLCGPCNHYENSVPYNLSVIPTDLCASGANSIFLNNILPQMVIMLVMILLVQLR